MKHQPFTLSSLQHKPRLKLGNSMRGFGLVEMMVAITLMMLITAASVALFMATSQSGRTVDSALQMDDTARYAFKIIENAVQNAGYTNQIPVDRDAGTQVNRPFAECASEADERPCPVLGFDNSKITAQQESSTGSLTDFGEEGSAATSANKSDSLAIRFSGSGTGVGDGNMVTCTGQTLPISSNESELGLSIFWVDADTDGEPALKCTNRAYGNTASDGMKRSTEVLLRGVETFQVMYGLDLCKPAASAGNPLEDCSVEGQDSIIDRWVSAQDVDEDEWKHVRAVRVGMVLRGAVGSAQEPNTDLLYPLGKDFIGTLDEDGLKFTPPADTRMRRVYTSVLMLRNDPHS